MRNNTFVVAAWHNKDQLGKFLDAWHAWEAAEDKDGYLVLQHDSLKAGCAMTKNAGVQEAIRRGAEIVVVLDDDCYPYDHVSLEDFVTAHEEALDDQPVEMHIAVTDPPSRGTPYDETTIMMPVAASMGFWRGVGDYDALGQLIHGARHPMRFHQRTVFGQYFALSGMNVAFRPQEWLPWCQFIDVPRFDDIWMGWLWQREAYRRGFCFNLNGPLVNHSRQSNVWQNLRDEAKYLEKSETLWREIATNPEKSYEALRALLPC